MLSEFTGKKYAKDAGNVLVGVSSGSLATQDIILDGGAVLDEDFNNTGQAWDSPLIYVKGFYAKDYNCVARLCIFKRLFQLPIPGIPDPCFISNGNVRLLIDFNNTGQAWDSPLIYVKGFYAMETGTVLQKCSGCFVSLHTDIPFPANIKTSGNIYCQCSLSVYITISESEDSSRSVRTAGAVDVAWDAGMAMDGGLICHLPSTDKYLSAKLSPHHLYKCSGCFVSLHTDIPFPANIALLSM